MSARRVFICLGSHASSADGKGIPARVSEFLPRQDGVGPLGLFRTLPATMRINTRTPITARIRSHHGQCVVGLGSGGSV